MKRTIAAVGWMLWATVAFAGSGASAEVGAMVDRFPFAILHGEGDQRRMILADYRQHVHVYREKKGRWELEWETTNLGSRVVAVFVSRLEPEGPEDLVIATVGGRILIYELGSYELVWENLQDHFDRIECMVAVGLDDDPAKELVFVADRHLFIYDGASRSLEWRSDKEVTAREIRLANVDDDEQLEIILNTGLVFDGRFYNVDLELNESFGDRIELADLNGDGFPEIIGELGDFSLKIYDIYGNREIW
jgi:hypothetical protein